MVREMFRTFRKRSFEKLEANLKTSPPIYKPGFLERWGKSVLYAIAKNKKPNLEISVDGFRIRSNRILFRGTMNSFLIGFIPSFVFVWFSHYLPHFTTTDWKQMIFSISLTVLFIGFFTLIEFYLLFKVGLHEAYLLAESANLELKEEPELITPIPGMLARIALEIPDPSLHLFGIDPYKTLNKKTVLIKTILYKLKVMVSNLTAKVLLKAILGRTGMRYYVEYVSAPITGFWDGYVTYKILYELRKRIISRKIAEIILNHIRNHHASISDIGKQTLMRAIANSIVFTKTFHPNFEYILLKLVKEFNIEFDMDEMDDKFKFEQSISKCSPAEATLAFTVFQIASCFDGILTKEELALFPKLFPALNRNDLQETTLLSQLIEEGSLKEAVQLSLKMLH